MRTISLVLLFLILSLNGLCQNIKITGSVVDNSLNGVSSATVCFCKANGVIINSTITDDKGRFNLKGSSSIDKRFLKISHVSYLPQSILIKKDTSVIICLEVKSYNTDEVVIVGKKRAIEFKNGNLVANVSAIPNYANYNAAKLLSKLPGVTASDKEGLTLNGASASLYIDGRKQSMSGSIAIKMLEALPASSLDQIELKAFADGTQDASGSGVIINLKTNKKKFDGYYLSLGSDGSLDAKTNETDGGMNAFYMFKKKNILFNTSLSYKHNYWWGKTNDSTRYRNASIMRNNSDKVSHTNTYIGSANLAWTIKEGHVLNFNAFVYDDFSHSDKIDDIQLMGSSKDKKYFHKRKNKGNDDLWSGNIEYSSPDSLASRVIASYGILYGGIRNKTDYYIQPKANADKEWYLNSNPEMVGYMQTVKVDFTQSYKEQGLELLVGAKADLGHVDDEVVNKEITTTGNHSDSHFVGDENVYALYLGTRIDFSKNVGISVSLRGEHTDYDINVKSDNLQTNKTYTNLFPYFHFYYKYSDDYSMRLVYVSGIMRPNYEHLLPGIRYSNEFSYSMGNPDLKPTISRGIAWANYLFGYGYIYIRYDYMKDIEGQVLMNGNMNIRKYVYMNYADNQRFSTTLYLPFQFLDKKLSGNLSSDISYSSLLNAKNGYVIPDGKGKYWRWSCKFRANYQITDKLGVNTWLGYNPSYSTDQYDYEANWGMDLGITYSMLKNDRLSFSLDAENIFDTFNKEYTYHYDGNVYNSKSWSSNRFIKLSINFKLNGGEKINNKARNMVNDTRRFQKD